MREYGRGVREYGREENESVGREYGSARGDNAPDADHYHPHDQADPEVSGVVPYGEYYGGYDDCEQRLLRKRLLVPGGRAGGRADTRA